jgi:hypothetical protein
MSDLNPPPDVLYGNMPSGQGSLILELFDRAIFEALGSALLPFPNPNDDPKLRRPVQQVMIHGVKGPGHREPQEEHGRVPVVFQNPEDIYNRYLLPGIRINRSAISTDTSRMTPTGLGWQYAVPSPQGHLVEVDGVSGPQALALRAWANPENLTYDIEVRARYTEEAQRMLDYVRYQMPERGALRVYSTDGTHSLFTFYRQGISETSELASSLNRFTGYLLTYEVQAEIDEHEEQTTRTLTHKPVSRAVLRDLPRGRVIREGQ